MTEPLKFRNPTIVAAVLGYVYDADEPVPWEDLLQTFTSHAHQWKTVENVVYELVAFGALHRIGKAPARGLDDSRALKPTPLGRAWLERELLPLPGHTAAEDDLEEADRIAAELADGPLELEIHTLEPGSEP